MADKPDNRVTRLAAQHWGVLSLGELLGCGLSRDMVSDRVRRGWLHPLHRGVYAVGHPNVPLNGRFLAAVEACGATAVLSHYSAATLYGLVLWDHRLPEVTATKRRTHPGIHVHHSTAIEATTRFGIPVTTPATTIRDLSSMLQLKPLRRATSQAMSLNLVTLKDLHAVNRGGNLARILATGPQPTRSELEEAMLDLIAQGGFETPDVNVPLQIDGRTVIPDFRWPAQRLCIEADGAAWHDHRLAREDDAERQAILEAHGERVVRITYDQATCHQRQTIARLDRAGAPKLHGS
jgi:very-short-patch-repair endonuclease